MKQTIFFYKIRKCTQNNLAMAIQKLFSTLKPENDHIIQTFHII